MHQHSRFCRERFNNSPLHTEPRSTDPGGGGAAPAQPSASGGGGAAGPTPAADEELSRPRLNPSETALDEAAAVFSIPVTDPGDIHLSLASINERLVSLLTEQTRRYRGLRWYLVVEATMSRLENEEDELQTVYLNSARYISFVGNLDEIDESIKLAILSVLDCFDKLALTGSAWVLKQVTAIHLHRSIYRPLGGRGGSISFPLRAARSFIPTPAPLAAKRYSIVNVKNTDERCFLFALCAGLFPPRSHAELPGSYRRVLHKLNMRGIDYPVKLASITKFEKQNETVSVNVFCVEDDYFELYPVRITKKNKSHHVDLLLIFDNLTGESHYCCIKNFNALCNKLVNRKKNAKFFCPRCLSMHPSRERLAQHLPFCMEHSVQKVVYVPPKQRYLEFNAYYAHESPPFWIACDFETMNKPLYTCAPDPERSYSHQTHRLEASMYSYILMDKEGNNVKPPMAYMGADAGVRFIHAVLEEYEYLMAHFREVFYPLASTQQDEEHMAQATHCGICRRPFLDSERRVRDHDHFCDPSHNNGSNIRVAAHNSCNLLAGKKRRLYCLFHNLGKFDSRIILTSLASMGYSCDKINVIAKSSENFLMIELDKKIVFLDSIHFLNGSLASLVEALHAYDSTLLKTLYPKDEERTLLCSKLSFPHDLISDLDVYDQWRELPPRERFFSRLSLETISEEEYENIRSVWRVFKIQDLRGLALLYAKLDVILLAICWSTFASKMKNDLGLEPLCFISLPHFTFNAALRYTSAKIELIRDPSIQEFIDRSYRGGLAQISERFVRADEKTHIFSWDARSMYGTALTCFLPTRNYRFLNTSEINDLCVDNFAGLRHLTTDCPIGFFIECDLLFPDETHDIFNSFPPAPALMPIAETMLSPELRAFMRRHGLGGGGAVQRLTPTLYPRSRYIVYGLLLGLYVSIGVKVGCIHRVLRAEQEPVFRPYLEFCSTKRAEAASKFLARMYKLMQVQLYGKCAQDFRRQKSIIFVDSKEKFIKMSAKPNFNSFTILNENLIFLEYSKQRLVYNRPRQIASAVCELGRYSLYKFFYLHLRSVFSPSECFSAATDTDSQYVIFKGLDLQSIYSRLKRIAHAFDNSVYDPSHPLFNDENKGKIGVYVDQSPSDPITMFVGCSSKLYVYVTLSGVQRLAAKGVPHACIRRDFLKTEDFERAVFAVGKEASMYRVRPTGQAGPDGRDGLTFVTYYELTSDGRCNMSISQKRKLAISPVDFKRFSQPSINYGSTFAHGHCKIREMFPECFEAFAISEAERLRKEEAARQAYLAPPRCDPITAPCPACSTPAP